MKKIIVASVLTGFALVGLVFSSGAQTTEGEINSAVSSQMANIRSVGGNPDAAWQDLSWKDLSIDEQAIWGVLGWDEDSWEEETEPPASNDKYWKALSPEEQTAAGQLGYTQSLWDER